MDSVDISELPKMKVAELKKLLKDRNLSQAGNKGELVKRLEEAQADGGLNDSALKEDDLLDDPEVDNLLEENEEQTETTEKVKPEEKEEVAKEAAPEKTEGTTKDTPKKIVFDSKETSDAERVAARAERFGVKSEDDQKAKRAARFGVVNDDEKKAARAAKFGLTDENKEPNSTTSPVDAEKLAKRQARFGVVEAPAAKSTKANALSTAGMTEEEKEKILKRKERFGDATSGGLEGGDLEKISKRKERFGAIAATVVSAEDEEKKKKRSERFVAA